jgi:hypothetical protein
MSVMWSEFCVVGRRGAMLGRFARYPDAGENGDKPDRKHVHQYYGTFGGARRYRSREGDPGWFRGGRGSSAGQSPPAESACSSVGKPSSQ